jgi:hypothetical protein
MKPVLLALALPVLLLTGCASGGYYGYDDGYYPGYYGGDYYYGGPSVDVALYDRDHDYYHHHDGGGYRHYDSGYRGSVASRGSTGGFHSGGTRVASSGVGHSSGHSGGGRSASAHASAGHH